MGRKMKLIPFLFKPMEPPSSSWPWPAFANPKTHSFRAEKTMNPVYVTEDESRLTDSSESESAGGSVVSITTELEEEESGGGESIESVIRGLMRSERLFFEPGTSSILGGDMQQAAAKTNIITRKDGLDDIPIKENSFVVMEMESMDPIADFRKSMEEMAEAHGLKYLQDWECLEELLNWYLRVNGKCNHGYIVGAFVDLLVALDLPTFIPPPPPPCDDTFTIAHPPNSALLFSSSASTSTSTSASNSSTGPCLSSLEEEEEAHDHDHDDHNKSIGR